MGSNINKSTTVPVFRFLRGHYRAAFWFSIISNLLMLAPSLYMMQVYDRVLNSRSVETLILLTLILVITLAVCGVLDNVRARILTSAGIALGDHLSPKVLKAIFESPAENVGGMKDLATLRSFVTGPAATALLDAPWFPLYLAVIYLLHPILFVVAVIGAAVMMLLAFINERVTGKLVEEVAIRATRVSSFVDSAVRSSDAVQAMGMLPRVTERWRRLNQAVAELQVDAASRSGIVSSTSKSVRLLLQSLMLGTGAYLAISESGVSPGIMIAGTILLGKALSPVENSITVWKSVIDARVARRRIRGMLALQQDMAKVALPRPLGVLTVERVAYAYGLSLAVKGVSVSVNSGEVLGIIGPNGSGKSTLARLMSGAILPSSGIVRLDGADLAKSDRIWSGAHIGFMPQDLALLSGSVGENIARLDDAVSCSEAIVAAAVKAGAHDMILRLPQGYDSDVSHLSQGQKQMVAMARALYGNPSLIILDEPNSALDSDGEAALTRVLNQLKQESVTVILVTHRPSLLGTADRIIALRGGEVIASGPADEIMRKVTPGAVPQNTERREV